jgi:hypothetical protein
MSHTIQVDNAQAVAHNTAMKPKNSAAVALGLLGGRAKGKRKARTTEQARAAALARWSKRNETAQS